MSPTDDTARCERCDKPRYLCVCDRTVRMPTRTEVLVLRHPQEPDKDLGTAPLLALSLENARVVTGLSWASLKHAVGRDDASNSEWGVMYLGSLPKPLSPALEKRPVVYLDRHGDPLPEGTKLRGVIALDGTWSQAKSLWWRNAWMLKLNRVLVHPREPSIYGKLRKEPRKECLSTLEAVAEVLAYQGEDPDVREQLRKLFRTMCQRARDASRPAPGSAP